MTLKWTLKIYILIVYKCYFSTGFDLFSQNINLLSSYDGYKDDKVFRFTPSFGQTRSNNLNFKRLFVIESPFVVQPTRRMVIVDGLAYVSDQKNKLRNK